MTEPKQMGTLLTPSEFEARILKARINILYAEMERNMTLQMFGDDTPPTPLTRRQRVKRRIKRRIDLYRTRVGDAWLVLTGRADIGGW